MTKYRVQVHVELKTGTLSVMAYEIDAEKHGFATMEGRARAEADPEVRRVTTTTWAKVEG